MRLFCTPRGQNRETGTEDERSNPGRHGPPFGRSAATSLRTATSMRCQSPNAAPSLTRARTRDGRPPSLWVPPNRPCSRRGAWSGALDRNGDAPPRFLQATPESDPPANDRLDWTKISLTHIGLTDVPVQSCFCSALVRRRECFRGEVPIDTRGHSHSGHLFMCCGDVRARQRQLRPVFG
jgi:hypothetical protein